MPAKRLSMKKIKEVLRLRFENGLSDRKIGRCCSISHRTVAEYIKRFEASGFSWPLPENLQISTLYSALYPEKKCKQAATKKMPEMNYLHRELKRPGVSLYMLWQEYLEQVPDGLRSTQFFYHYKQWAKTLNPVMRQQHKAGEKAFVDWAGKKPEIVDPRSGEVHEVELFVGCMGASSYTYAEARTSQKLFEWIDAHKNMLAFFGASPSILVPDNLKTGVTKACRYEPDLNPTYQAFASHYGVAVIPARVAKPKDKAKVENAVGYAERMILGGLRDQVFFSLDELNSAIYEVLEKINSRPFQKLDVSRRQLFEQLDKPLMKPLPKRSYEYGKWKKAKVNIDYHVEIDASYYSVPYTLIHKQVEVHKTASVVEVWFNGVRIASHARSYKKGTYSTLKIHMPHSHRHYLQWTPQRILSWGKKTGPFTAALMEKVMAARSHPEQGFRSCLGILRLAKKYNPERLENACRRALSIRAYSYKSVKSILDKKLDAQPLPESMPAEMPLFHSNIRGKDYYN